MVFRVFRVRTRPGRREDFVRLSEDKSFPYMRAAPGLLLVHIGRPPQSADDVVIVSVWKDLDSLKRFAGPQWEDVVILPGEAELLIEATVQHFDETYRSLNALHHTVAGMLREREAQATATPRLTPEQWERVSALLPAAPREGRPRADDRRTLEGILYVLRTGCHWQEMPAEYGSYVTCWRRLTQWEGDGTWERIWAALFATLEAREKLTWAHAFLYGSHYPVRRRRHNLARPASRSSA